MGASVILPVHRKWRWDWFYLKIYNNRTRRTLKPSKKVAGSPTSPSASLQAFAPEYLTEKSQRSPPDSIHMDTGLIHIACEISKVREPRKISIQPNLEAWLRAFPLTDYPVIVADFKKRREQFKDRFQLTHDVMRHTFISMFVAKFRSIGEAALQAGNSESIIRKHYLDLKSKEEAEEFFSIFPTHARIQRRKTPASRLVASLQEKTELKVG